jgi:hypothetical protein
MALAQELEQYLKATPLRNLACPVISPHLANDPALFFVLAPSDGHDSLNPDGEQLASQLIQQLSQEIGLSDIFTEDVHADLLQIETDASDADERLRTGAINGVQHAQLVSSAPLVVVTLDEKQDYGKYKAVLAKWHASQKRTKAAISLLNGALKRTVVLANKTIQAVLIRGDAYRAGRTGLNEYIRHVVQQAELAGIEMVGWPDILTLHRLALKEQEFDVEQAKREIELFGEKLMQALSEKEVWMRQTIEALSSAQPGEMHELEAQLQFLTEYLSNSFNMRKLRESLFFRIAMYGAYAEGLDELEKPRAMVSRGRREKAFITGVLQGPTHILMTLTKQLLAADAHQQTGNVPDVYDFILDVGIFTGFDDEHMPHLIKYVQYGNRYKALVTPHVLRRLEALEFQILERAVASEQDREVVHVHNLLTALRKRVLLQLDWGKQAAAFGKEQAQDNFSLLLKQHHLVRTVLKKEAMLTLDVLNGAESLAREYYQRVEQRGQMMAANVRSALAERGIDRAVVYIEEQSCKVLLNTLTRQDPNLSYAVLHPGQDAEAYHWSEFERDEGEAAASSGELPVVYKNAEEHLGVLLRKNCENPLCRVTAPAIYERVVCTTAPASQAVFYCATCKKRYCGLELKPVPISEKALEASFSIYPLEFPELSEGTNTFALQCRHCGHYVGKQGKTVIWAVP